MSKGGGYQLKLDRLERLVDALLEERKGLIVDLRQLEGIGRSPEDSEEADPKGELAGSFEKFRKQLAESEATNQQLLRERDYVRERLEALQDRLGQIEAKLLEQRSTAGAHARGR